MHGRQLATRSTRARRARQRISAQTAVTIDGRIAGTVGFHHVSWEDGNTEIGYWLAEQYQGRGVITAAVRVCTNHALRVWGLQRVEIEAAVDNARSRAVAERLGFQSEGVRRQAHKVGERHHDVVVYSMLAPDWRA